MAYRCILAALLAFLPIFLTGLARPAAADYLPFSGAEVAPNIAEIEITPSGVAVRLEIYIGDLRVFGELLPDAWLTNPAGRPGQPERWGAFANNGLSFRRGDGTALPMSVQSLDRRHRVDRTNALSGKRDPVSGRVFPAPPEDTRVLYAELFYDFQGRKPDALTISPPVQPDGKASVSIGMLVFDREIPVTGYRFLSHSARLAIDWDDPWFSRFDNPAMQRHHKAGVSTYLYLEPREVRHETLIRVREMAEWVDLPVAVGGRLTPDLQAAIRKRAAAFLLEKNPVSIDGAPMKPGGVRAEILRIGPAGLEIVDAAADVSANAAFVGAILSFPVSELPGEVDVTWEMFNDRVQDVPSTMTDPAGPFLSGARPDDPGIVWTNHLLTFENPRIAPVPAGAAGAIRVPALTAFGVAVAIVLFAAALWRSGRARLAVLGGGAIALAVAAAASNSARVTIPNPLARPPDAETARSIFAAILDNVHIANLDPRAEARSRDLQSVVMRATLADVAAEVDRALAIRVPGGGLARVTAVDGLGLSEVVPSASGFGFQALAEWSVTASAGHFGHSHVRNVSYRALVDVIAETGQWKLAGLTVLEVRMPDV